MRRESSDMARLTASTAPGFRAHAPHHHRRRAQLLEELKAELKHTMAQEMQLHLCDFMAKQGQQTLNIVLETREPNEALAPPGTLARTKWSVRRWRTPNAFHSASVNVERPAPSAVESPS